jgi:hypothetical protein
MDGEVDLCLSTCSLRLLLPYRLLRQYSNKDRYIKILVKFLHTLIPLLSSRNTLLNNLQYLNLWLLNTSHPHLLTLYLLITQLFLKVMLLTHNGVRYLRLCNPRCTMRITIITKLNIPIMLLIHNKRLCLLDMIILGQCMLRLLLSMGITNSLLIINRWDSLRLLRQRC